MTDARPSFPLTPWFSVATGCFHPLCLSVCLPACLFLSLPVSVCSSLFLFYPLSARTVHNGSSSGNWNPVIYGARPGEDSWINVQPVHAASRTVRRPRASLSGEIELPWATRLSMLGRYRRPVGRADCFSPPCSLRMENHDSMLKIWWLNFMSGEMEIYGYVQLILPRDPTTLLLSMND